MKALWMIGVAIALGGCAVQPQASIAASASTDAMVLVSAPMVTTASGNDCATWRVQDGLMACKDDVAAVQSAGAREVPALEPEQPPQVVGPEAHHLVLDGVS
jgi:hypothetical protein